MDGRKFRVAKEASEAEIEGERLEVECGRAEGVLGELKRTGRDGAHVDGRRGEESMGAEQAVYVFSATLCAWCCAAEGCIC